MDTKKIRIVFLLYTGTALWVEIPLSAVHSAIDMDSFCTISSVGWRWVFRVGFMNTRRTSIHRMAITGDGVARFALWFGELEVTGSRSCVSLDTAGVEYR
jgi:hypothetical protein